MFYDLLLWHIVEKKNRWALLICHDVSLLMKIIIIVAYAVENNRAYNYQYTITNEKFGFGLRWSYLSFWMFEAMPDKR